MPSLRVASHAPGPRRPATRTWVLTRGWRAETSWVTVSVACFAVASRALGLPARSTAAEAPSPPRIEAPSPPLTNAITDLHAVATLHLGKTADWVAIANGSVWVATTGPFGVVEIDTRTDTIKTRVPLPGNPCSGLALGFGGLWVPLCTKPASLARIDLRTHQVTWVDHAGPAAREGGIAVSDAAVWLVVGRGTLANIDPTTMRVRQRIPVPAGALNPAFAGGRIWVTRPTGAGVAVVDAGSGAVLGSVVTHPGPRFIAADARGVWTLDQGDGALTHIDPVSQRVLGTTALGTPGPGGDVKLGHGLVWTTMMKTPLSITDAATGRLLCRWRGPGGDSLDVGGDSLWLTDYTAGDVRRYDLADIAHACADAAPQLPTAQGNRGG